MPFGYCALVGFPRKTIMFRVTGCYAYRPRMMSIPARISCSFLRGSRPT